MDLGGGFPPLRLGGQGNVMQIQAQKSLTVQKFISRRTRARKVLAGQLDNLQASFPTAEGMSLINV